MPDVELVHEHSHVTSVAIRAARPVFGIIVSPVVRELDLTEVSRAPASGPTSKAAGARRRSRIVTNTINIAHKLAVRSQFQLLVFGDSCVVVAVRCT